MSLNRDLWQYSNIRKKIKVHFFQKQDGKVTYTEEIILLYLRSIYHRSVGYIVKRQECQHSFKF